MAGEKKDVKKSLKELKLNTNEANFELIVEDITKDFYDIEQLRKNFPKKPLEYMNQINSLAGWETKASDLLSLLKHTRGFFLYQLYINNIWKEIPQKDINNNIIYIKNRKGEKIIKPLYHNFDDFLIAMIPHAKPTTLRKEMFLGRTFDIETMKLGASRLEEVYSKMPKTSVLINNIKIKTLSDENKKKAIDLVLKYRDEPIVEFRKKIRKELGLTKKTKTERVKSISSRDKRIRISIDKDKEPKATTNIKTDTTDLQVIDWGLLFEKHDSKDVQNAQVKISELLKNIMKNTKNSN